MTTSLPTLRSTGRLLVGFMALLYAVQAATGNPGLAYLPVAAHLTQAGFSAAQLAGFQAAVLLQCAAKTAATCPGKHGRDRKLYRVIRKDLHPQGAPDIEDTFTCPATPMFISPGPENSEKTLLDEPETSVGVQGNH